MAVETVTTTTVTCDYCDMNCTQNNIIAKKIVVMDGGTGLTIPELSKDCCPTCWDGKIAPVLTAAPPSAPSM